MSVFSIHLQYAYGQQAHTLEGQTLTLYSAEKTLADCLKYASRLGQEPFLEGLKTYLKRAGPEGALVGQDSGPILPWIPCSRRHEPAGWKPKCVTRSSCSPIASTLETP